MRLVRASDRDYLDFNSAPELRELATSMLEIARVSTLIQGTPMMVGLSCRVQICLMTEAASDPRPPVSAE